MERLKERIIDIEFDIRRDSNGIDPDRSSATLRKYHKALWSKPLPCGNLLILHEKTEGAYLFHRSDLGEFCLSSDSIVHTYSKWKRTQHIIEQVSKNEMKFFYDLAHTIGGYLVFPGNRVNGLPTINQERGTNRKINDRFDLTLECIRRFYSNEESPMSGTLMRYKEFFLLFSDFKGYCEFFLLQDIVSEDFSQVIFFLPFENFDDNPLPKSLQDYLVYKTSNINFLKKRNERIDEYSQKSLEEVN